MFGFIKNLFCKIKENDIDETIQSMSVDEYNEWLEKEKDIKFKKICQKLENILDKAWQHHVYNSKKDRIFISKLFVLTENDYGITFDEILSFYLKDKVRIGDFLVWYSDGSNVLGHLAVEKILD